MSSSTPPLPCRRRGCGRGPQAPPVSFDASHAGEAIFRPPPASDRVEPSATVQTPDDTGPSAMALIVEEVGHPSATPPVDPTRPWGVPPPILAPHHQLASISASMTR
ncbi:UNVERIFIED_CONTAM: hypothetical protein Sindi_0053000, partial [Sesamum indicum]